jgi:hypothetical protein
VSCLLGGVHISEEKGKEHGRGRYNLYRILA